MQTTDESLLFRAESDHQRAEARRKKTQRTRQAGDPIDLLSKPLDLVIQGQDAYVATSGFSVKRISLKTGKTKQVYKGHTGPVACLALWGTHTLITGSWDKSVKFWDTTTKSCRHTIQNAHTDFVKALLVIPEFNLLITGGSDKDVRIFDLSTLDHAPPSTIVASLREHTRPIECLKYIAPWTDVSTNGVVLCSADTMGKVCAWAISRDGQTVQTSLRAVWIEHETAVYDMVLTKSGLWTASSDKTVLFCSYDWTTVTTHNADPIPKYRIFQPYYVKCLLPLLDLLPDLEEPYLITGSTDETIRVYDMNALQRLPPAEKRQAIVWDKIDKKINTGLVKTLDEHTHEINKLGIWMSVNEEDYSVHPIVISTSLDETLRRWPLEQLLDPSFSFAAHVQAQAQEEEQAQRKESEKEGMLTAEEEAELAELMDD